MSPVVTCRLRFFFSLFFGPVTSHTRCKVATLKKLGNGNFGTCFLFLGCETSCYCQRGSLQPELSMFLFKGHHKLFCTLQPYREESVVMFMKGKEGVNIRKLLRVHWTIHCTNLYIFHSPSQLFIRDSNQPFEKSPSNRATFRATGKWFATCNWKRKIESTTRPPFLGRFQIIQSFDMVLC